MTRITSSTDKTNIDIALHKCYDVTYCISLPCIAFGIWDLS